MLKENPKVLMVMAHPDDEILFGWPIFQDKSVEKNLIICSSDFNNPERQWCKYRKNSLIKVCEKENVPVMCLDYNSSFYRTPTRRPSNLRSGEPGDSQAPFRHMCDTIKRIIKENQDNYDYIFTHNPHGEYGHIDHKLLFELVLKVSKKPVLITDINMPSNWSEKMDFTDKINMLYYNNKVKEGCIIDFEKYKEYEKIYIDDGVWTWSREVPRECNLYII